MTSETSNNPFLPVAEALIEHDVEDLKAMFQSGNQARRSQLRNLLNFVFTGEIFKPEATSVEEEAQ